MEVSSGHVYGTCFYSDYSLIYSVWPVLILQKMFVSILKDVCVSWRCPVMAVVGLVDPAREASSFGHECDQTTEGAPNHVV